LPEQPSDAQVLSWTRQSRVSHHENYRRGSNAPGMHTYLPPQVDKHKDDSYGNHGDEAGDKQLRSFKKRKYKIAGDS
jgi:hypothetical protein